MKKYLYLIPLIFTIILSAIPIASVYAAYPNDLESVTAMAESVDSRFKTLQECLLDLGNPDTYVYFRIAGIDSDDGDKMIYTYFSTLAVEGLDVTEEDNVYTFSYSSNGSNALKFCRVSDYAHRNSDNWVSDQHAVTIGDPYSGNNAFISCSSCSLDLNTMKCSIIDDIYDEKYYIIGEPEIVVDGVKLNDDSLNIEVIFNPSLSGDVNREVKSFKLNPWDTDPNASIVDNITNADVESTVSETFSMTVKNHSRFGVEFLMAIVPQGQSINFYGSYNSTPTALSYVYDVDTNPLFVYWSQSWNYFYDSVIPEQFTAIDHELSPMSNYFNCRSQCSDTPWHFVEKNDSYYTTFDWKAINLQKGVNYDVVVYAVKCDYGQASRQCQFPDMDYYVDYSAIQQVYRSTFRITRAYTYDSSFKPVGYKNPSATDAINLGWSSVGYIDSNGQAQIKNETLSDYMNNLDNIRKTAHVDFEDVMDSYRVSDYSNSNSSYSSIISSTNSVFSFITGILARFPSGFLQIFTIGFWSIVIISIIKRVH